MNEHEKYEGGKLREFLASYHTTGGEHPAPDNAPSQVAEELVRTQVYLSVEHRDFLQSEAKRRGESMAAVLREVISLAMKPAASSWVGNPLLEEVAVDASFESSGVGSESADAAIYGSYQP